MDKYLTFDEGIKALSDSGGRALGAVIKKAMACRDLGFKTFTELYRSCVCPVLDYGAGVWGYTKQTHCKKIQCRALRYYLGVRKNTPKLALYGDTGWEPCQTGMVPRHTQTCC